MIVGFSTFRQTHISSGLNLFPNEEVPRVIEIKGLGLIGLSGSRCGLVSTQ